MAAVHATWSKVLGRTKAVSPSKLAVFSTCALRYLFETERGQFTACPAGPFAARGVAVHKVIEDCGILGNLEGPSIKDRVCRALVDVLTSKGTGSITQYAFENNGIEGLFSREQLIKVSQFVKRVIRTHGNLLTGSKEGNGTMASSHVPPQLGSEKWFESDLLDLAGKIDLTYLAPNGSIHIVDFKTGKIRGQDGQPKVQYVLQVAAYSLLIEKVFTGKSLVL